MKKKILILMISFFVLLIFITRADFLISCYPVKKPRGDIVIYDEMVYCKNLNKNDNCVLLAEYIGFFGVGKEFYEFKNDENCPYFRYYIGETYYNSETIMEDFFKIFV